MEKTIKLHKTQSGWFAQFINDPQTVSLFNSDLIPTAYTSEASREYVKKQIQALNPDYCII